VSAATNAGGTKVVLTYDGALSATTAAAGDFVVKIGSTPNDVTVVAVVGSTVELTLTDPVVNGDVVTVGYTDPTAGNDANAIQDAAGNDAVTLVDTTPVTNSVPAPDETPPVIVAPTAADVTTTEAATWVAPDATATDDTDETVDITVAYSSTDPDAEAVVDLETAQLHLATPGNTVTVTYSATDAAGNVATETVVFTGAED
jgi:uncharacterized repeat protein (TIGR02059 family)